MTVWEVWHSHFGELAPIAHVLRPALPARWMRFHSLPESKRHVENRQDKAELLKRHNEAAVEILGEDVEAILFLFAFLPQSDDLAPRFAKFAWARAFRFDAAPPLVYQPSQQDDRIVVCGCRVLWYAGAWDSMLRDVGDCRVNAVVMLNPRTGEIYAPYDGGADLFLRTPDRVAQLRRRWASWLPDAPRSPRIR